MSNEENVFRFELNETLHFHPGDEVQELINISLEPDVTIHESESYTTLQGEIELQGEFLRKVEDGEGNDQLQASSDVQTKKFIDRVVEIDLETGSFTHYFPIEISVPSYRVEKREHLQVEMKSFDYELPTSNMLELTAIAEIHGIEAAEHVETEQRAAEETNYTNEETSYFEFQIDRELNEEKDDVQSADEIDSNNEVTVNEEEKVETNEGIETGIDIEPEIIDPVEMEYSASTREEAEEAKEQIVGEDESLEIEREEESSETQQTEISVAEAVNTTEENLNDVSYLTDIFRETEEEQYTKMKICIVQENDTIEKIADRFEVSALQLIKNNALDDEYEVLEGQLLYIPKK